MGEDGYFTHKYFSVSPDRLVLQEDSFQFKFVFTSLTSSNSADQHKHRSHRFRTCCVVFRHLLTLCFSSEARLYASVALIDALPSGSLYNWRPPPPSLPLPESRTDGQLTDVLMSQRCHEPYKHIRLLCCAPPHTVWPHNQADDDQIQMLLHAHRSSISFCLLLQRGSLFKCAISILVLN